MSKSIGMGSKPGRRMVALTFIALISVAAISLTIPITSVSAADNRVGPIVADVAALPFADPHSCQGVISAVQGGGSVEQAMNQWLGTDFQPIAVSPTECTVLVSFLPVVGSYNDLILAAQSYNANDQTSVQNFYEKTFILAAEVTLIGFALDGILYKASFQATGELNNGLKLGKLRSLCGDACYSDVLSSLYWFIKGTASGALGGFIEWAGKYLPVGYLPPLPPICGVPILGDILKFFGLMGCRQY